MLTRRSLGPLFLAVVLCAMASFTTSRSRAAPAAQQPGDVTQSDDFSDPSRGVLPRSVNNDQFTVAVEDGEYVIRKPEGTNNGRPVVRPAPGRDYADASIAFDARLVGQTNDRFLTAGCRRPATGPGGYMTFVNPRYQWIDIYRSDGPGQLTGLVSQWSSAVVHDRLMHRYEFLCVGDTVAVRVDGAIAAWVQDATFTSGRFEVGVGLNDARQAVEGRLDNLAARGWVARERCPSDKRGTYAVLTDLGFAELERAAPTHVRGVRRHFVDLLSPDQLSAVANVLEQVQRDCTESAAS